MTNAEAWFNIALRPRKPEGSLGRTAQDGHLDSHTQLLNYESTDGGGRGRLYTYRYTITTRIMTSALRRAAMKAVLMFYNCEGRQSNNRAVFEKAYLGW